MAGWLTRRVLQAALTLVVAATVMFFLMRLAPGDPLARLGDERPMPPEEMAALRRRYGLDRPLPDQFRTFVGGALTGDFGHSIQYNRPVVSLIAERLPASLLLGGTVLLVNFTVGIWLGVIQARRRGRPVDHGLGIVSLAGYSMPSFWVGLLLAWLFGLKWRVLPVSGMHDPFLYEADFLARAWDTLGHLVLPALTLVLVSVGAIMRHQRSAMLEALIRPFVLTARAKGLPERRVVWRHAWRNALFPVITLFGLWLPLLVTGSVFVEYVFAWPGLGALAAGAAGLRDYPLLMGTALLASALVIGGGMLTDAAYRLLDPRVRRE